MSIRRNPAPTSVRHANGGLAAAAQLVFTVLAAHVLARVGPTGPIVMTMSFAIFSRRRRDRERPETGEALQPKSARGAEPGFDGASPVDGRAVRTGADNAQGPVLPHPPSDEEAGMPRWRRPSLIKARKADPTRAAPTAPRLSFESGRVGPVAGHPRRLIRYHVVRLMDGPDEIRAADLGQLDQGDEVQLLEKAGAYWLVLCPDGRRGWLHQMTLGEVLGQPVTAARTEAWDGDVDPDVLEAYLASRSRD